MEGQVKTIFGIKGVMTTRFDKNGKRIAVTQIKAEPSVVVFKKEGRVAIGFGKTKKPNKPQAHFITSVGFVPKHIKEIKVENANVQIGDKLGVSVFEKQDLVKVSGTSKGRGFSGGIRRWGFHGGPKTHGQSDRHRAPGSIGQTTTPGRVFKGKKMAGQFGDTATTTRNLEVFAIDLQNNVIEVIGAVPGTRNGLVVIEKTGKAKAYTPPPVEKVDEEEEEKKEKKEEANEQKQAAPEEKGEHDAKS